MGAAHARQARPVADLAALCDRQLLAWRSLREALLGTIAVTLGFLVEAVEPLARMPLPDLPL